MARTNLRAHLGSPQDGESAQVANEGQDAAVAFMAMAMVRSV
jgi:hypothetical protein